MNPGLVVKLRPAGPWRIGPDSGARNRVDFIYHSDSLYSAVVSAMARLGSLDEWLDATVRRGPDAPPPAVCFSSCFPFLGEIGYVVPPRTVWPPVSRAVKSARVRWKSARFVPLGVVQSILNGQRLDENHWTVDGASECLVPNGKPGPFRTAVRWSAAVDRLTGTSERHSTACLEFRPGAGLWTIVSFLDDAAHARWSEPVKAAFRLLADTGFGGERSRGWGRAETPEFIDGSLPDMILPPAPAKAAQGPSTEAPPREEPEPPVPVTEPPVEEPPVAEPPSEPAEPVEGSAAVLAPSEIAPLESEAAVAPAEPGSAPVEPIAEVSGPSRDHEGADAAAVESAAPVESPAEVSDAVPVESAAPAEPEAAAAEAVPAETVPAAEPEAPAVEAAPVEPAAATEPEPVAEEVPAHPFQAPAVPPGQPHWLLSLFTPAPSDEVDWRRGNYTVLARGGRVDSPAGSGELKKQIQMVSEGSVVYAPNGPCGSAADVAPDGFAHPVFRAGFAVSIPLPEVS